MLESSARRVQLQKLLYWLRKTDNAEFIENCDAFLINLHQLLGLVETCDLELISSIFVYSSKKCVLSKTSPRAIFSLNELSELLYRLNIDQNDDRHTSDKTSDVSLSNLCIFVHNTLDSMDTNDLQQVLGSKNLPLLAHIVSFILSVANSSRDSACRLEALRALKAFVSSTVPDDEKSQLMAQRISFFSRIFPGISHCLFSIVFGEKGRNSSMKSIAFNIWAEITAALMGDHSLSILSKLNVETLSELDLLSFNDWLQESVSRLKCLFVRCSDYILSSCVDFSSAALHRLHGGLVDFSSQICLYCWSFLNDQKAAQEFRDHLISVLISIAADQFSGVAFRDDKQISRPSSIAVETLAKISNLHFKFESTTLVAASNFTFNVSGFQCIRKLAITTLLNTCSQLNCQLSEATDERKCSVLLDRMHGILRFLGEDGVEFLVENANCLEDIFKIFIKFLTPDLDSMHLMDQVSIELNINQTDESYIGPANFFQKFFLSFRQSKILKSAENVASALSCKCTTFDGVFRVLDNILISDVDIDAQILLLLSASIYGLSIFSNDSNEQKISIAMSSVESFSRRNYFKTCLDSLDTDIAAQTKSVVRTTWPERNSNSADNVTLSEIQMPISSNEQKLHILNTCLFMELLANCSKLWSYHTSCTYPDELQPFLVHVLSMATGTSLLASTARQTLVYISRNCGFHSFSDFVSASSGPLLSSLTLDFHSVLIQSPVFENSKIDPPPDVVSKLSAACRALIYFAENANSEALHRIRPLVMQMLMCLDVTYNFASSHFLPVLMKIVEACDRIHRMGNLESRSLDTDFQIPASSSSIPDLKTNYLKLLVTRRQDQSIISQSMDAALSASLVLISSTRLQHSYAYSTTPPEVEMKTVSVTRTDLTDEADQPIAAAADPPLKIYPDHIRLVEEIMLRSIHLMSCDAAKLRILSMSLLCKGCCLLADNEDLLLPLVHKIWSPLISRMRDGHPAVVEKAFELFATLASVSRSFIRARASSELMGTIVFFLERGALVSSGEPSSYEFLTACRVQKKLLQTIGPLCVHLQLLSSTLRPVVQVLSTYLDKMQPKILREASAFSLLKLYELDAGLVAYEISSYLS